MCVHFNIEFCNHAWGIHFIKIHLYITLYMKKISNLVIILFLKRSLEIAGKIMILIIVNVKTLYLLLSQDICTTTAWMVVSAFQQVRFFRVRKTMVEFAIVIC
jgi:hypothetical protein